MSPPELREYQKEGIAFLARYRRAILADEQGVGKTVQALMAARQLHAERILVVAPKSASGVWVMEAEKWLGEVATPYQGSTRNYADLDSAPIVVTNYVLFKEVMARKPKWNVIIFDEAHKLRNRKRPTLFQTALKAYSPNLFFLTGTPIFTSAGDLWPPLHLINPAQFRSYWKFVKEWTHINYNGYGYQILGTKHPERLQKILYGEGLMLRRLKKDVMPELPPKTRMSIPIEMHPKQRQAYETMVNDLMIELSEGDKVLTIPSKLALFTRLRQLLVSPKLIGLDTPSAAINALKEDLEGSNDAMLVFTPFAEALPILADELKFRQTFIVRGGMTSEAIAGAVKGFQLFDGPKVLLASLLMGTSWAATEATQVRFLGYDWSPANNFQAEDRPHRHGQLNAVTVGYYVHEGTIDEHIMDILDEKTTVAKLILDTHNFLLPRKRKGTYASS